MDSLQEVKVRAIADSACNAHLLAEAILQGVKGDFYGKEPEQIDEERNQSPAENTKSDELPSASSLIVRPNPFTESTEIIYNLKDSIEDGYIKIYGVLGNLVKEFKIDKSKAGIIKVDLKEFLEGIYYCNLILNNQIIESRKLLMIK